MHDAILKEITERIAAQKRSNVCIVASALVDHEFIRTPGYLERKVGEAILVVDEVYKQIPT